MSSARLVLLVLGIAERGAARAMLAVHGAAPLLPAQLPSRCHRRTSPSYCALAASDSKEVPVTVQLAFDEATRGSGKMDRTSLRKVLDSYGLPMGSDEIMRAYDEDSDGGLTVNEFSQLVTVLEATRAPASASSEDESELGALAGRAGEVAYDTVSSWARSLVAFDTDERRDREGREVSVALQRMQRDMAMLDQAAGVTPQLSQAEFLLLLAAVSTAFVSPLGLSEKVVEVLVPSMAALCAAVGFSAEYTGKVAVSKGKEIAATTLIAAAEAELYLSQAERGKAIIPLCVGLSATAAALALVVPAVAAELALKGLSAQLMTEIYLVCPLISVLAAAVAALAAQESASLASRAVSVGARRFASSRDVGRTWLSATEQITASTDKGKEKWVSFSLGVLPAPALAALCPGALGFKAIVAAAVAAAQCAYSLARAEYTLADAVESVALKSRTAAVSDTYANQGARAGAILPFTSALSGLCAATTVAVVELLPLISAPIGQSVLCVAFPALGALIAAAASISKARCEVDAEAATAAATQLAETDAGRKRSNPIRATVELVRLTVRGLLNDSAKRPKALLAALFNALRRLFGRGSDGTQLAAA